MDKLTKEDKEKINIKLVCDSDLAYDSPDHISPRGTMQDNSTNPRFNRKVYRLLDKVKRQIRVLDMGCSGGGFIRECNNDGCLAIGLEGSDYSEKHRRAEWAIIPEFLFTCDIGKNFKLFKDNEHIKFNLITSWEYLEHINPEDVDTLIKNIKNNLLDDGIFIASLSNFPDICNGIDLHQSKHPKKWWYNKFKEHGLYERKELYGYFNNQYVRGGKSNKGNFHIIFSKNDIKFDNIKLNYKEKFKDMWIGNYIQRCLEFLVTGKVLTGK